MERIGGVLHQERRQAPRYEMALRLVFPWHGRILETQTVDVSKTGMRIKSPVELPVGTRLVVHFAPLGSAATARLEGQIVWLQLPQQPGDSYLCGFRFSVVDPAAQIMLAELINDEADAHTEPRIETQQAAGGPEVWAEELRRAVSQDHARAAERNKEAEQLLQEGQTLAQAGEHAKAVAVLEKAMGLAPHEKKIVEELARVIYLKGDIARAAELFDKALRMEQEG